jgi:transcriptional regulator with XRE-family HTH domain
MKFKPQNLLAARKAKELSVAELADVSKVAAGAISNLENGKTAPHEDTVNKLATALQVDWTFFYTEQVHLSDHPTTRATA